MKTTWEARFKEDYSFDIRARVMAKDATGSAARAGEGYCLKRADLASITMTVKDITDPDNPSDPSGVTNPTTLTISNVISDTLVTTAALWSKDQYGYNFAYIVPASKFPTGKKSYAVEITFTTTGGTVGGFTVKGYAEETYGS